MPLNEREALLQYLGELYAATAAGKLYWKSVNPTTYAWDADVTGNARLVIQRVERIAPTAPRNPDEKRLVAPKVIRTFLFQAFDLAHSSGPRVTVDGGSDTEVNEKLRELFQLIKTGVSPTSLTFLKSLLPK